MADVVVWLIEEKKRNVKRGDTAMAKLGQHTHTRAQTTRQEDNTHQQDASKGYRYRTPGARAKREETKGMSCHLAHEDRALVVL